MLAPSTRGRIELQARLNPAEAFTGMEQFSHVWIVFVFHQNTNAAKYFSFFPYRCEPTINGFEILQGSCLAPKGSNPKFDHRDWAAHAWASFPRAPLTDPIPLVITLGIFAWLRMPTHPTRADDCQDREARARNVAHIWRRSG